MDVNCLGVRLFVCEDYHRGSSAAVSVAFLGHCSVTTTVFGFVLEGSSTRPDLSISAVLLSDAFPRGYSRTTSDVLSTVVRTNRSVTCAIDNFVVELETSMEYDDANTLLEPVALNVLYTSTDVQLVGADSQLRKRCAGVPCTRATAPVH